MVGLDVDGILVYGMLVSGVHLRGVYANGTYLNLRCPRNCRIAKFMVHIEKRSLYEKIHGVQVRGPTVPCCRLK